MRLAAYALALLAALAAFLTFFAGGVLLLVVESSGERGAGALLAVGSAIAFALTLLLVFGRDSMFSGSAGATLAVLAGAVAMLPITALAFAFLRFAGIPFESATPLLDWSALVAGLLLCLGALAMLAIGWRRGRAVPLREDATATQSWTTAESWTAPAARPAAWKEARPIRFDADPDEDDVRVTPVRRIR